MLVEIEIIPHPAVPSGTECDCVFAILICFILFLYHIPSLTGRWDVVWFRLKNKNSSTLCPASNNCPAIWSM